MFIREVKKQNSKSGKVFYQYSLMQTARVLGKVKQSTLLYLGSHPLLLDKKKRQMVLVELKFKIFRYGGESPFCNIKDVSELAKALYEKYLLKYKEADKEEEAKETSNGDTQDKKIINPTTFPPNPTKAEYHQVDIKGIELEEVRSFGAENLCKQVLDKLHLKDKLKTLGFKEQEAQQALIAIAGRALFCTSEHQTAKYLEENSSLKTCFNYLKTLTHHHLYTASDHLYKHKDSIDSFLHHRINRLFGLADKMVIFDLSNTYFEGRKSGSTLAQYGRSKEKRRDCKLTVFTGVINREGFIHQSKIYPGNKADSTTLEDMIGHLEQHRVQQKVKKHIVMDAGIATEENLMMLREKGYDYTCVARNKISDYQIDSRTQVIRSNSEGKGEIKLNLVKIHGSTDTYMYVESGEKKKKETSMKEKLTMRFIEELTHVKDTLSKKGTTKRLSKVHERVGRIKERHKQISGRYHIEIAHQDDKATDIIWKEKPPTQAEKDKREGVYFIRTNVKTQDENQLWDTYNTIREVEATFRTLKTELNIRPIYHQKDERTEAHIYLTLLAYQLVNTIRHMLKTAGIRHQWTNIKRIMNTQTMQTVVLPTEKKNIFYRKSSYPDQTVKDIYKATGCKMNTHPVKQYIAYH